MRVEYFALTFSAHRMLPNAISSGRRLLLAAVAVCAVGVSACTRPDNQTTPVLSGPPSSTFPMPPLNAHSDLGWVLSDGRRAKLADFQGKVLVLDFYATWCEPCRDSIPGLISLEQNYGASGLQVVGLNVGGPDDRIKVAAFAKELHIQYPLGFPDQALSDLFLSDYQSIPQTFVIGRDGQPLRRFVGYSEDTGVELERVVGEAIKK